MANTPPSEKPCTFLDDFEARWLASVLRRHGRLIAVAVIVGALTGAVFHMASPARYQAEAVVLVNIHLLKMGLDNVPMEVELVRPTRRLVGTVCESDLAISLLAAELDGELSDPSQQDIDRMLERIFAGKAPKGRRSGLRRQLYFDQRGMELVALRATDPDPVQAARIANTWARVSQRLLYKAYGTTTGDIQDIKDRIDKARLDVLAKTTALERLGPAAAMSDRLEATSELELSHQVLAVLNERYAQLLLRLEDSKKIIWISSAAAPPDSPTNPSAQLVIALFALSGFLFGLVIAMLRGPGRVGDNGG